jgi:hypothetical protein
MAQQKQKEPQQTQWRGYMNDSEAMEYHSDFGSVIIHDPMPR